MDTPLCPAYIQLIEYILKNKEKQIQDLILWNSWNLEKIIIITKVITQLSRTLELMSKTSIPKKNI